MKNVMIEDLKVKVNNKREQQLVDVINGSIAMLKDDYYNNTFGKDTHSIITRNMVRIQGWLSSLYMLDMIDEPVQISDLDWFKTKKLFPKTF